MCGKKQVFFLFLWCQNCTKIYGLPRHPKVSTTTEWVTSHWLSMEVVLDRHKSSTVSPLQIKPSKNAGFQSEITQLLSSCESERGCVKKILFRYGCDGILEYHTVWNISPFPQASDFIRISSQMERKHSPPGYHTTTFIVEHCLQTYELHCMFMVKDRIDWSHT